MGGVNVNQALLRIAVCGGVRIRRQSRGHVESLGEKGRATVRSKGPEPLYSDLKSAGGKPLLRPRYVHTCSGFREIKNLIISFHTTG